MKKLKRLLFVFVVSLLPTFFIWLPFFARITSFWGIPLHENGMATIVSNYDGPLYLVVAKTFYDPQTIKTSFQFPLPVEYYAAHFPLFPLLTKLFSYLLGYPYAMLATTLASSILAIYFFKKLAEEYIDYKDAYFLTFIFALFPARWLIVRSVGAADPLFVAGILASVYYFRKKKYWASGLWGAVAQLTKSPGILLFVAYGLALIYPEIKRLSVSHFAKLSEALDIKKIYPLLLIPASLLTVFIIYKIRLNDWLAYFHSGNNIHLIFPPFSIFNYSSPWVGTFWLEEVIFVYLFGLLGLFNLIKNKDTILAWVMGVFLLSIFFIAHRDIIRYSLPIVPFLLLSFSSYLTRREFRITFYILLIPIYLFSLAYISQNVMPISDWAPFL